MGTRPASLARLVHVQLLQDDMGEFERDLPYRIQPMKGKSLFTENVIWGEVWIAERCKHGMWWAGYVRDGELYLDRSKREKFLWNRKHNRQIPSPLKAGRYKIWLDAWVRADDYTYTGDARFTRDGEYGDGPESSWKAPPPPARKYWQDIEVRIPPQPGEPCRLKVRSRRFHWVYRLSRLVDVLDELLASYEKLVANVAEVRTYADWLRQFLAVLYESGTNMSTIEVDKNPFSSRNERKEQFERMQWLTREISVRCQNFINFGADESYVPWVEREHINNVAQLLWRLVTNAHFAREVAFFEPAFAEEHRIMLSRLGHVFNRIPRSFARVGARDRFSLYAEGMSVAYGRKFSEEFTLPYYNEKIAASGKPLPFTIGAKKPPDRIKWLNSARRYTISMLNAASIFVNKSDLKWDRLRGLLELECKLRGDELIRLADQAIEDMKKAGKWEAVAKLKANQRLLVKDALAADSALDTELKRIDANLEELGREIQRVEKREPQKVLDGLKNSNPKAIYGIQSFEILVKWLVVDSAWNAFVDSAGGPADQSRQKAIEAVLKTLDFEGSVLQALGLQRLLRASWMMALGRGRYQVSLLMYGKNAEERLASLLYKRLATLGKVGKALGAIADVGAACVYSYDIFVTGKYGDELLERYLPEDATTMYAFHLVTWGGKWMVGIGSSVGVFSKSPVGGMLQAIGYLAQLTGEFGEELAQYGAAEHKLFHDVHSEMAARAGAASHSLSDRGCRLELHPYREELQRLIEQFKWLRVDAEKLTAALAPGP